jgi:hypothetical protein
MSGTQGQDVLYGEEGMGVRRNGSKGKGVDGTSGGIETARWHIDSYRCRTGAGREGVACHAGEMVPAGRLGLGGAALQFEQAQGRELVRDQDVEEAAAQRAEDGLDLVVASAVGVPTPTIACSTPQACLSTCWIDGSALSAAASSGVEATMGVGMTVALVISPSLAPSPVEDRKAGR